MNILGLLNIYIIRIMYIMLSWVFALYLNTIYHCAELSQ